VLLVFGVMLTNRVTNIDIRAAIKSRIPSAILCAALLFILVSVFSSAHWISYKDQPWVRSPWNRDAIQQTINQPQGTTKDVLDNSGSRGTAMELGKLLMTDYALPFELVSVVLLVALMGAAMIARRDVSKGNDNA
jgi:NADH-quinone oxidoreductase subunit J